jgi:hypothetical protein
MSSSTVSVLWVFLNIVIGYVLVCRVGTFGLRNIQVNEQDWDRESASFRNVQTSAFMRVALF